MRIGTDFALKSIVKAFYSIKIKDKAMINEIKCPLSVMSI